MDYFCTLFDSNYLSRGLAMYESLEAHSSDFHLFIFAFDDISYKILKSLDLKKVTIISLNEFETDELLKVKNNRSKGEYCWTCTPSIISHSINSFKLPNCTYLDADLMFYSDPSSLIKEMKENNKNVLITEHRFSPLVKLYELRRAGRFCVQFMTFTDEKDSLEILDRWRLQCIEWCYARYEDGKFGDQKYLDEWPEIYKNVHILKNLGGGVAPWNLQQYTFEFSSNSIVCSKRNGQLKFQLVFFHFQYVKLLGNSIFDIGWYWITKNVTELLYIPYLKKIKETENIIQSLDPHYKSVKFDFKNGGIRNTVKKIIKKNLGYNLLKIEDGISDRS